MSGKKVISATVDSDLVDHARAKRINISAAAENGILTSLREKEVLESEVFPEENAALHPDIYWINHEGKCVKRAKPQFFINENGHVIETSKENYFKWLGYYKARKTNTDDPRISVYTKDL